jgi:hypothetical protein
LIVDEGIKRQQNLIDEETYLKNVLKINENAIDKKLALLKGANAAERLEISQLQLERLKIEQDTSDKIFEIRKNSLKGQLDQQIATIRVQQSVIENDPSVSATDRAQAKLDADNQILVLQQEFNKKIDLLEKQAHHQSEQNAKESAEALRKIQEEILKDQLAIAAAALSDIATVGSKQRAQFNIDYEKLRQNILTNDRLTATQRANALEKLAKTQNLSLAASQLAQDTIAFKKIEEQYNKGLATEQQFIKAQEQMEKSHTEFLLAQKKAQLQALALPSSENTQKNLGEQLSKLFGFSEGSAEQALLGKVIADSFATAQLAMNNYFDAEQARVQQSLDLTLQRIDLEKQQAQARAQSQAEIDSIEKQAQAKTKAAQRQAGEQLKKVKKSEARVALATELANIAVSAAANPLNGVTFGAAGAIMYGLLAALALARYAINVSAIERQQFKYGGLPGESITTTNNNSYYQKQLSLITPKWYAQKFAYGGSVNETTPDQEIPVRKTILEKIKTIFSQNKTENTSTKYSFGGKAGEVPTKGGKFGGKPHSQGGTKFTFKKNQYEAEVDELAIIRTRNAPKDKKFTVHGTQMQIASFANMIGGGIDFKPGARASSKFATGGTLGATLQAPIFTPSSNNNTNNDSILAALKEQNELLRQQNVATQNIAKETASRVDRLEVVQVTQTVSDAQRKHVKQTSVGTIS